MRLRDPREKVVATLGEEFRPEDVLQTLNDQAASAEKDTWQSYTIEVITPIFGGGVKAGEPDMQMPIRASAIRGQLRYWWRFLAANRRDNPLSGKELFKEERDIWGGMSEEGKDYTSKVRIRVGNVPNNVSSQEYPSACPKKYHKVEYALFSARKQNDKPASKLITQQISFDLKICAPEETMKQILPALSWWASFGGIGARTRRGAGSIKVTCDLGKMLTVPEDEIEKHQCQRKCLPPQSDSFEAWKSCIQILQEFRQLSNETGKWIGVGRKTKKKLTPYGKEKDFPSISCWPEPNAIRKTTKEPGRHPPSPSAPVIFPRALFGMPLAFPFMSDGKKPKETKLLPKKKGKQPYERFASPLILKPVANEDGKYLPTALLMPYCHLCDLQLVLQYQDNSDEWIFEPSEWCDRTQAELVDPIKNNNGTDALTAFMNFFAKGGR